MIYRSRCEPVYNFVIFKLIRTMGTVASQLAILGVNPGLQTEIEHLFNQVKPQYLSD